MLYFPLPRRLEKVRWSALGDGSSIHACLSGPVADATTFEYTSGRWLYNETQQLMQRYTPFNVSAMHSKIAKVCGADVVSWDKKEGVFNKSFITTLSNGKQVVVRVKVRYLPYRRQITHYLERTRSRVLRTTRQPAKSRRWTFAGVS